MPIYEYRCDACGHEMEALQKISDNVLTDCPACEQPALKKLISAAGFRLSGSGWYETDFKNSKQKNLSGDKTAPQTSKEGTSNNSSDASVSKSKDSANNAK